MALAMESQHTAEEPILRPAYTLRASASVIKDIIRQVLDKELSGQTYQVRCACLPRRVAQVDLVRATKSSSKPRPSPMRSRTSSRRSDCRATSLWSRSSSANNEVKA